MPAAEAVAYYQQEANTVRGPFALVSATAMLLVGVMLSCWRKFPSAASAAESEAEASMLSGLCSLCSNVPFMFGVATQFLYVGAQVGVWSFTIRYAQVHVAGTSEQRAADYLLISLLIFIAGRFITTALLGVLSGSDHIILSVYAVLASLLSAAGAVERSA